MQEYLQSLSEQLSSRDAAEALGFARSSQEAVKALYRDYGVVPPVRKNQHAGNEALRGDLSPQNEEVAPEPKVLNVPSVSRRKVGVERLLNISDLHIPNHDERAVALVLKVAEEMQPEIICIGGDLADVYALSRWPKDPNLELMLQEEIDMVVDFLRRLRAACPDARIVWVEGNHEVRLRDWLKANARALYRLDKLSVESLFELEELGVEYIKSNARTAYFKYGVIRIGHFDRVNPQSAYTAKLLVDKYAESLVQGHTHRGGVHYRTYPNGETVVGVESFCLCETNPDYCETPNWQQGFVVITKRTGTDRFHVQPVPIVDYECLFNDVLYSA